MQTSKDKVSRCLHFHSGQVLKVLSVKSPLFFSNNAFGRNVHHRSLLVIFSFFSGRAKIRASVQDGERTGRRRGTITVSDLRERLLRRLSVIFWIFIPISSVRKEFLTISLLKDSTGWDPG